MCYHALAAVDYAAQADNAARAYVGLRSARDRRRAKYAIAIARKKQAWHASRAAARVPVPAAVAKHAAVARHWLAVARSVQREQDRHDAFVKFRAAMRAAGVALRDHLGRTNENAPEGAHNTKGHVEQIDNGHSSIRHNHRQPKSCSFSKDRIHPCHECE